MPGFRWLVPASPRGRRRPSLWLALALGGLVLVAGGGVLLADARGMIEAEGPLVVVAPARDGAVALAGVTEGEPAAPTASDVPEATPYPPDGAAVAIDAPPSIALRPAEVGNGETMLLSLEAPGGVRGTVEAFGRSYPLLREGHVLWAVLGTPLDAVPGSYSITVRLFDGGGRELAAAERPFSVVTLERPVDHLVLTPDQAAVLTPEASRIERELRVDQFVVFDRQRRWDGPWIRPTEGWETTLFGEGRSYNGGPVTNRHLGLDIANAQGTPIVAPAPGRVAWVGEMPIRGRSVLIDHGAGVVSGYHHLVEWSVEAGELVEPGDLIGLMGSTGLSTGPHLHWELSIYGVNVDPDTWTRVDFTP